KGTWFLAAQDGRILLLQPTIRGERRLIRRASDQLHAPGIQWLHHGRWRASDKVSHLLTGHGICDVHLSRLRLTPSPLLGGLPRYEPDIRIGLPRQATPAGKPIANPPGSRIVGGCRKPEVSELTPQVAQELRGVGNRFDWIKGVGETARVRRRWHELRHALRSRAAYCRRVEAAL